MSSSHRAEEWVGRKAVRHLCISSELIDRFADLSGDRSPIHVDDKFARERAFPARVAHGMLLGSLVSEIVGMELPGQSGVMQEMRLSFRNPCHPGDQISIHVEASEFFESVQTLVLKVEILRADGTILASGQVRSGLR